MSRVIGRPLSRDEYKELVRLITLGAQNIRQMRITPHHKAMLYEGQFRCMQMAEHAPDVVRLEMKKARDIIKDKGKLYPDGAG